MLIYRFLNQRLYRQFSIINVWANSWNIPERRYRFDPRRAMLRGPRYGNGCSERTMTSHKKPRKKTSRRQAAEMMVGPMENNSIAATHPMADVYLRFAVVFRVPSVPEMERQRVPLGMHRSGTMKANGTLRAISGNSRPILI